MVWITCLDGTKPVQLPLLQRLQRILDSLLQAKSLSIKLADGSTVLLVSGIGFLACTDMRGVSIGIRRIESLGDETGKSSGPFSDTISDRCER